MSPDACTYTFSALLLGCTYVPLAHACNSLDRSLDIEVLSRCAEQGHPEAQLLLGEYLQAGHAPSTSLYQAAQWYLKAARAGNVEAQYRVGLMYLDGLGVTEDGYAGFDWISRAAMHGHPDAKQVFEYLLENPRPLEC